MYPYPTVRRLTDDPYLHPHLSHIRRRHELVVNLRHRLTQGRQSLADFSSAHEYFGLHLRDGEWILREWAPHATSICLVGDFNGWQEQPRFRLARIDPAGNWEIRLPADALQHGQLYKLRVHWRGGSGERIPAYARRVVQDEQTKIFSAQVWRPAHPYVWRMPDYRRPSVAPVIYESHVGMAQDREGIGTYTEFKEYVLPRIRKAGYNTVQLMAVMEHPYYGSFGYHVSSFFAASSRFGTPEELKDLVDAIHESGMAVIMDLVHSHAVKNEVEGLSRFDGSDHQYFHAGDRGTHPAWDSRCFDYGKTQVIHFLLSNCRYWLDEFKMDGYRFDGVTSMMYHHRGLGCGFSSYDDYFGPQVDEDAVAYLALANEVIHDVRPDAITIAEDVSGMPGLGAPIRDGGCGFDYRLAMGVPDCWFKLANDIPDEQWSMHWLWHELTNRRPDEKVVSYVESHDQALVGGKSMIFELIDAAMYHHMSAGDTHLEVDRGIALHKMMRLVTLASAGHGYLNFIGNEFGHPEWVDFPREGNGWSYKYARRKWHLRDDPKLKYHFLADFDEDLVRLFAAGHGLELSLPRCLLVHDGDKVIAFERSDLFCFLNFHSSRSFTDYGVEALPGAYELVLDTDAPRFGGHGRVQPGQRYHTEPVVVGNLLKHMLRLYLPARCGLVLRRLPR